MRNGGGPTKVTLGRCLVLLIILINAFSKKGTVSFFWGRLLGHNSG